MRSRGLCIERTFFAEMPLKTQNSVGLNRESFCDHKKTEHKKTVSLN